MDRRKWNLVQQTPQITSNVFAKIQSQNRFKREGQVRWRRDQKKKEKKRSQKRRLLVQWSQSLSLSPVVVVVRGEREVRKGGQGWRRRLSLQQRGVPGGGRVWAFTSASAKHVSMVTAHIKWKRRDVSMVTAHIKWKGGDRYNLHSFYTFQVTAYKLRRCSQQSVSPLPPPPTHPPPLPPPSPAPSKPSLGLGCMSVLKLRCLEQLLSAKTAGKAAQSDCLGVHPGTTGLSMSLTSCLPPPLVRLHERA